MRSLEKARQDPEGTMAKTLAVARRVFGDYGFHGTTTRMIAQEAGVDVATLYYHWGEKQELYEAVVMDITEDLRQQLRRLEQEIHGRPLGERMARSIDAMTDYLFEHPEVSNLVLLRYFAKTRSEPVSDLRVPSFVKDIASSMQLAGPGEEVSPEARMQVLAIMNAIYNFVSGREFFQPIVEVEPEAYVALVKSTLKFLFIPAFTAANAGSSTGDDPLAEGGPRPATHK